MRTSSVLVKVICIAAILFFFLPWGAVSCSGQEIVSLSGFEVGTGLTSAAKGANLSGVSSQYAGVSTTNVLVLIFLLLAIALLVVSIIKRNSREELSVTVWFGAVGTILMLIFAVVFKSKVSSLSAQSFFLGQGNFFNGTLKYGWWLSLLAWLAALIYPVIELSRQEWVAVTDWPRYQGKLMVPPGAPWFDALLYRMDWVVGKLIILTIAKARAPKPRPAAPNYNYVPGTVPPQPQPQPQPPYIPPQPSVTPGAAPWPPMPQQQAPLQPMPMAQPMPQPMPMPQQPMPMPMPMAPQPAPVDPSRTVVYEEPAPGMLNGAMPPAPVCIRCGAPLQPGMRFCNRCGSPQG